MTATANRARDMRFEVTMQGPAGEFIEFGMWVPAPWHDCDTARSAGDVAAWACDIVPDAVRIVSVFVIDPHTW